MAILSKTFQYLRASRDEVKKIVWPTRKDTIKYSIIVIAVSIAVAIYLYVLDQGFQYLFSLIFG